MLTYDPVANLTSYPGLNMRRFGVNPYNEPLYRIVFASSRRHLVYGTWPDGSQKASWVRKYFQVGDQWIMERWLAPQEYARMSKEQWNREMLILGPYPDRGEYEICHTFETSTPDDASLEKLISWIEAGRHVSLAEKTTFQREDAEREAKAVSNQQDDMIRNRLRHFGAVSGYGGGRGELCAPILRTAEELGLPTVGGKRRTRNPKNAPTFEVPLEI
jgi:hypothetical protein